MKYKKLGKSGIKVSEIGFGAWTIALNWWGKEIQEDEAKRMLKKAYDLGINFFETADMYGKGKSEKLIGEVFSGMRDEVIISTKYFHHLTKCHLLSLDILGVQVTYKLECFFLSH